MNPFKPITVGVINEFPNCNASWETLEERGQATTNRREFQHMYHQNFCMTFISCANLKSKSTNVRRSKNVSFSSSVGLRCVISDPVHDKECWYSQDEVKSMKAAAMNSTSNDLRHSLPPVDMGRSGEECRVRGVLSHTHTSSTSLNSTDIRLLPIPRASSAAENLISTATSSNFDRGDIRRNKMMAEIDKEVFIDINDRRKSSKRRIDHYWAVLEEQDRQADAGVSDIKELAAASMKMSKVSLIRAINKARSEATVAKAILLQDRLTEELR